LGVCVSLSLSCLSAAPPLRAGAPDGAVARPQFTPGPVRIRDSFTATAVRGALQGAARRLQKPHCQLLFAEFTDQGGRSLGENLAALGETGDSYMDTMLFYDAEDAGRCRGAAVLAFTQPGSRVVHVCGRTFEKAYRREPWLAEAVLIHESLHSLGLGENPPSSLYITGRVMKRCVR
jgi:hypothetical protein